MSKSKNISRPTLSLKTAKRQRALVVDAVLPDSVPTPEPTLAPILPPLSTVWHAVAESVVGMAHRRMSPAMPCQDASSATVTPRTTLIVCDGAGSAKQSHIGAQTLVQSLNRLLFSIEGLLMKWLDMPTEANFDKNLADMIYRYAVHQMKDLGETHLRSDRDFRATLLLSVVGQQRVFWFKVGDGELVVQTRDGTIRPLGQADKGEFANQTVFVDTGLTFDSVQYGTLDANDVTGLALMSDGASERLVAHDGSRVAQRVADFMQALVQGKLAREQLFLFLNEAEVWQGSTHDDKSIALAAR
jgi:hypothetical protein